MGRPAQSVEYHLARNADLIRLWQDGKRSDQIADALGMTRSAVMGRVCRLRGWGVDLREGVSIPANDAVLQAVEEAIARENNNKWTPERIAELQAIWLTGSAAHVAAHFGLKEKGLAGVVTRMRKAGYHIPHRPTSVARKSTKQAMPFVPKPKVAKPKPEPKPRTGFKFGLSTADQAKTWREVGNIHLRNFAAKETGQGVTIMELRSFQCRTPMGGSGYEMLYCGKPIDDGVKSSYCPACRPRFFMPTTDTKAFLRGLRRQYA